MKTLVAAGLCVSCVARAASADDPPLRPAPVQATSGIALVKTLHVDRTHSIEIRKITANGAAPEIRAVLVDPDGWWSIDQGPTLRSECGAGHCDTVTLTDETMTQVAGVLWIRFELASTSHLDEGDSHRADVIKKFTTIEACKLGAGPAPASCAYVQLDGVAGKLSGTDIPFMSDDGTGKKVARSVHFAF